MPRARNSGKRKIGEKCRSKSNLPEEKKLKVRRMRKR